MTAKAAIAVPEAGHFLTDGKKLVEVVYVTDDAVEVEDCYTYAVTVLTYDKLYKRWRQVTPSE